MKMKKATVLAAISLFILISVAVLMLVIVSSYPESACSLLELRHDNGCCNDFNRNAVCDDDEVFFSRQQSIGQQKMPEQLGQQTTYVILQQDTYAGLRQLQATACSNNLIAYNALKTLEDEQRKLENERKNWKRKIGNKYIFGYDDKYDPRAY